MRYSLQNSVVYVCCFYGVLVSLSLGNTELTRIYQQHTNTEKLLTKQILE